MCALHRLYPSALRRNVCFTYHLFHLKYTNICTVISCLMLNSFRNLTNKSCIIQYVNTDFSRCLMHSGQDSDSETDDSSEPGLNDDCDKGVSSLRNFLYPDSDDPIICKLNTAVSVQEVFDTLTNCESDLNAQHVSQAVLILWDLQKIFYNVYIKDDDQNCVVDLFTHQAELLNHYIRVINNHGDFKNLIELLEKTHTEMNPDAATCTLLYLKKMGVSLSHPVMQKLISHCSDLISASTNFPLTALSRFSVAVYMPNNRASLFTLKDALPLIFNILDKCNNAEVFYFLTICMNNVHEMIDWEKIVRYKRIAEQLVLNGELSAEHSRTILKAAVFLNLPHWSHKNSSTIRMLLLQLKGRVAELKPRELFMLHKIFLSQLEPTELLEEIKAYGSHLLSKFSSSDSLSSEALQTTTNLLSCVISFSPPSQKNVFEELARQHIEGGHFSSSLPTAYKFIRHLKTSDKNLCDALWNKTLQDLQNSQAEREDYKLLRVAFRYMHFNNNLAGTYRHYEFERHMIQWLLNEMENGIAGMIPSKFARIASFLLAYGNTFQGEVIDEAFLSRVVNKLVEMIPQFTPLDCLIISRGFQIAMNVNYKKRGHKILLGQYTILNSVLNSCAQNHLNERDLDIGTINIIAKAFINHKGGSETDIFQKIIKRYESCNDELSSRVIRDAVQNFQQSDYLVEPFVERMVEYVVDNKGHLLGETAEKLLYLCYIHGYIPKSAETFLSALADLAVRDKDMMSGLSILRYSLALCFYNSLPESLIHYIFTVDFLERIELELSQCYSKATYPLRVRQNLMELNRAVCLDYPDADIPWFHKKYCQETAVIEPKRSSLFQKDVLKHLEKILGGQHYVKNDAYSPYSYRIDFLVLLDDQDKPVRSRNVADSKITKIALLLLREDAFSGDRLKGPVQMRQRHLEMLGYRVVNIPARLWQSMFMAEPHAKTAFLESHIFAKKTVLAHQQ